MLYTRQALVVNTAQLHEDDFLLQTHPLVSPARTAHLRVSSYTQENTALLEREQSLCTLI